MSFACPPQIAVAPMLDWTDRHCRYFLRLLSPHVILYTEMITTGALLHNRQADQFLAFSPQELPLVLQLGGSSPSELALCAKRAEAAGFSGINLNVGCPSARVQKGCFGAALMARPDCVAECVAAMQAVVSIPVTVKTRIGIDHQDSYDFFYTFIRTVYEAGGCEYFIIHARKAWLSGLSPKENRTIPSLHYDWVYQIKQAFPQLTFMINGGITDIAAVKTHAQYVDGVMIGRESYHNPYFLATLSQCFYATPLPEREAIIDAYLPYAIAECAQGVSLATVVKPLFGLFHGCAGGKRWRRYLSEHAHKKESTPDLLLRAKDFMTLNNGQPV